MRKAIVELANLGWGELYVSKMLLLNPLDELLFAQLHPHVFSDRGKVLHVVLLKPLYRTHRLHHAIDGELQITGNL